MTTAMNEAEKLAQVLERPGYGWSTTPAQCAALLRRQAEQIKLLRGALQEMVEWIENGDHEGEMHTKARSALAATKEET